ncbi:hypothetical protein K438DRAFT_1750389 [Mycena galopus ATCC 62051]|nr:hypothetical protein K438DRAFT_1750389 [Mycena galopus ATCC 62051]
MRHGQHRSQEVQKYDFLPDEKFHGGFRYKPEPSRYENGYMPGCLSIFVDFLVEGQSICLTEEESEAALSRCNRGNIVVLTDVVRQIRKYSGWRAPSPSNTDAADIPEIFYHPGVRSPAVGALTAPTLSAALASKRSAGPESWEWKLNEITIPLRIPCSSSGTTFDWVGVDIRGVARGKGNDIVANLNPLAEFLASYPSHMLLAACADDAGAKEGVERCVFTAAVLEELCAQAMEKDLTELAFLGLMERSGAETRNEERKHTPKVIVISKGSTDPVRRGNKVSWGWAQGEIRRQDTRKAVGKGRREGACTVSRSMRIDETPGVLAFNISAYMRLIFRGGISWQRAAGYALLILSLEEGISRVTPAPSWGLEGTHRQIIHEGMGHRGELPGKAFDELSDASGGVTLTNGSTGAGERRRREHRGRKPEGKAKAGARGPEAGGKGEGGAAVAEGEQALGPTYWRHLSNEQSEAQLGACCCRCPGPTSHDGVAGLWALSARAAIEPSGEVRKTCQQVRGKAEVIMSWNWQGIGMISRCKIRNGARGSAQHGFRGASQNDGASLDETRGDEEYMNFRNRNRNRHRPHSPEVNGGGAGERGSRTTANRDRASALFISGNAPFFCIDIPSHPRSRSSSSSLLDFGLFHIRLPQPAPRSRQDFGGIQVFAALLVLTTGKSTNTRPGDSARVCEPYININLEAAIHSPQEVVDQNGSMTYLELASLLHPLDHDIHGFISGASYNVQTDANDLDKELLQFRI